MINGIDRFLDSALFRYLRIGQFLLALSIFTYLALMPATQVFLEGPDYVLHFIGNVLLYLSAYVALFGRIKTFTLVIFLLPYSLCIEMAQFLSPSRHVDFRDVIFNLAGLFVGFLIATVVVLIWNKLKRQH